MKILDIKLVPQFCLGFSSQFPDLELTDLVASSLAWPGHIPINLYMFTNSLALKFFFVIVKCTSAKHVIYLPPDIFFTSCCMCQHVLYCLFSGPTKSMHT